MSKKKSHEAPEEELLVLHEKWVKAAQEHLREIIVAALLIVLVAAGWSLFQYQRSRQESKAAILYMKAVLSQDSTRRSALLAELQKRYAHTAAALAAELDLFAQAYDQGKLKEAALEIKKVKKSAKGDLKIFATQGQGYVFEEQGHYQKAAKDYQTAADAHVGLEKLAWLDLARVYELSGDRAKAVEFYRELMGIKLQGEIRDFVAVKLARLAPQLQKNTTEAKKK